MSEGAAGAPRQGKGRGPDWRALAAEHGTPLLVLDCDRIRHQYRALTRALPDLTLHYAIKALPDETVLRTLADEGCAFDIATNGEIDMLEALAVDPGRCIHTHPIKRPDDIARALRYGCTTFVADNVEELDKLRAWRHRIGLLLRVSFPNPSARVDLSRKFGCAIGELPALLAAADARGLHVKGLSFHVGSQTADPAAHVRAIEQCAPFFRARRPAALAPRSVLDIGGGFPADYDGRTTGIDAFCAPLRTALAALPPHVRVIAEPGRFIAAPAMTCLTAVVGRAQRGEHSWYYLDDGVYGSFSGQIYDHTHCPLIPLIPLDRDGERFPSVLAGPTCDSIDVIAEDVLLPRLEIGDLVMAPMIGAYSWASASEFNSLPRTRIHALAAPEAGARLARQLRLA